MAAHLRSIEAKCSDCGRRATVQLFSTFNDPMAKYCQRDGAKRLKQQLAQEERMWAAQRGQPV